MDASKHMKRMCEVHESDLVNHSVTALMIEPYPPLVSDHDVGLVEFRGVGAIRVQAQSDGR